MRPLPHEVLEGCLEALAEAAEYLEDIPDGAPVPELSEGAREWLGRFRDASEDDLEDLWDDDLDDEVGEEVYQWVRVRTAALRPAVLELVTELADRAPGACARVKEAWQPD